MLEILGINLGVGGDGHGNTQMYVSMEDFKLLCDKTGKKTTYLYHYSELPTAAL